MPVNYDSIIEKLAEDPEFLDLNPDEQDQLVQELAQEKMGVIPKSGNLLERAIKNQGGLKNSAVNFAVGGLPSAMNPTDRPEDALPAMAQLGTDFAFNATPQTRAIGSVPGVKYGSTVAATTGAEGIRQGAKYLRGEPASIKEIGKTGLETAGIEGLFRGGEQMLFKSQIGKELIRGAKGRLGQAIRKLGEVVDNNPGLQVMRDDVLGFIDHAMEKVIPVGPQASGLRRIRNFVAGMPEQLGPREISNLEGTVRGVAEFRPERAGTLKNKAADASAKNIGGHLSGMLDSVGEYAGVPVKEASRETHNVLKEYGGSQKKKGIGDVIKKGLASSVVGGAVGYKEQDPLAGAMAGGLTMLGQSEGLRNLLYKLMVKSGASKAGRVGISEIIRQRD